MQMILLVSATWPERALVRAQLEEDTGHEVLGADSAEGALEWLTNARPALVILDTHGLSFDAAVLEALRAKNTPVLLLTGAVERSEWETSLADLNVKSVLVRPAFIGDVSRAARKALARPRQV